MRCIQLIIILITSLSMTSLKGQSLKENTDKTRYSKDIEAVRDSSKKVDQGQIRIIGDEQITQLNVLRTEYPPAMNGYRVQIFFGDRQEAIETKSEFTELYPDIPAYISFLAPNFRLRIGDFRTKIEAERLKKEIEADYSSAYIVKDKIELPPLYGEEEDELMNTDSEKNED